MVEQETLQPDRSVETDTFRVAPDGRVIAIDGAEPGLNARVDLLPRLPSRALEVGAAWSDTLHVRSQGAGGEDVYEVVRENRGVRMVDTLGRRVVEVASSGRVRFRTSWWENPEKTLHTWFDLSGPVEEVYGFDPALGRILYRSWRMELRGVAGVPGPGGVQVRLPAGLRSASRQLEVDEARIAQLRQNPEAALTEP